MDQKELEFAPLVYSAPVCRLQHQPNEAAPTIAPCSRKSGPLNLVVAKPVSVPWPHGPSEAPLLRRSKRVPVPVKYSSKTVEQLICQKIEEIDARYLAERTKRKRKVPVRLQCLNLPLSAVPEIVTTSNVNDREPQSEDTFSAAPSPSVTMAKAGNRVSPAATRTAAHSTLDLISWLKGVCQNQLSSGHEQMFTDMRCYSAGNLMFVMLDDIEYAFYDTDGRKSLGYLRFKPKQKKPAKKSKRSHLHFIVLAGEFDIGTDRDHGTFNVGDMVAINIGCRYTIENVRDDVGLLMVIIWNE